MGGIYKISCAANRHLFIGSAKDFDMRWNEHLQLLRKNKHFCQPMQSAWNRFGERQFAFAVIEHIGDEDSKYYLARESAYIRSFQSKGVGLFNTVAMGCSGRVFNQERISSKISSTLQYKAVSMSEEDRKALWGRGRKGMPLSEEHKRKMSETMSGGKRSLEVRKRMSIGQKESFANNPSRKEVIREVGKRNAGRITANAIVYVVDGVEYPSGSSAMRALGITAQELFKMVRFGGAIRVEKEPLVCQEVVSREDSSSVQVPSLYNREDDLGEDVVGFYI